MRTLKRHILLLMLSALLANTMTSCSPSAPKEQKTEPATTDSTLTAETVICLFNGLEEFGNTPEKVMTDELYHAQLTARFMPSDGFGDMDSYDESSINYDIIPMDAPDTSYIIGAEVKCIKGDTAQATATVRHIYGEHNLDYTHKVILTSTPDGWLINDYSDIRAEIETFIAEQRALFRSKEWVKRVNRLISNPHYHPYAMQTLKEIDEYFEEYPMPNDTKDISKKEILELFHAIPGYWEDGKEWKRDTVRMKESFSASTYQLIEQLFETPELEVEGWPDSFWTEGWIRSYPQGCYGNREDSILVQGCHAEYCNDSLIASIEIVYHCREAQVETPQSLYLYEPMRLYLIKENGKWVIEDFYCRKCSAEETYKSVQEALPWMKNCIQAYIGEIKKKLRSTEWKEENNPDKVTDPVQLEKLQRYLKQVEDYFQKYPEQ